MDVYVRRSQLPDEQFSMLEAFAAHSLPLRSIAVDLRRLRGG